MAAKTFYYCDHCDKQFEGTERYATIDNKIEQTKDNQKAGSGLVIKSGIYHFGCVISMVEEMQEDSGARWFKTRGY